MYVWSKSLVAGLLMAFVILLGVFLIHGTADVASGLKAHTTRWMAMNYAGLTIWIFVWMIDQARVRGKNVWIWLFPFLFAPFPVLMLYVIFLQKKLKA